MSDDEIEDLFKSADTSNDGRISVEEFSKAFYSEMHG